jgi:thioredoxin-like negative regulator of GroEL
VKVAQARLDRLYDPDTPASEVAELVWEQYEGDPVLAGLATLLAQKGSTGEPLPQIADALDEHGAGSLTALTFRALVARERGDQVLADRLVDSALDRAPDPDARVGLAPHLHWHGRTGEALHMLREHLAEDPDDDWAAEKYGVALEAVHTERSQDAEEARRRDEELARFGDRDSLSALRAALEQCVPGSPYAAPVAQHLKEWLDAAGSATTAIPT